MTPEIDVIQSADRRYKKNTGSCTVALTAIHTCEKRLG